MKTKFFIFSIFSLFSISFSTPANALVYFEDNFDGYADSPANHSWIFGSNWSVGSIEGRNNSRCMIVHAQNDHDTAGYQAHHDPNPNGTFAEGYVRFSYKIINHDGNVYGTKFLKLHGVLSGANYANYTFQFSTESIMTGDGSGESNDAACGWRWGSEGSPCTNTSFTWNAGGNPTNRGDGNWHTFETYVKENTNGNYDGEIGVWFDGIKYLEATGIRIRHDTNVRDIDILDLFAYSYNSINDDSDDNYYVYYDDIIVSDTYNGPAGSGDVTAPSTPSGLSVS